MLESIWIENFKSYKTGQTLPLAPITLMIGANASGKSNAIEAFRFLSWFAGGEKLSTIQNRINDSEKIFRGDVSDLFNEGETEISLGINFQKIFYKYFSNWRVKIKYEDYELRVEQETLTWRESEVPIFSLAESTNKLEFNYKDEKFNLDKVIQQKEINIPKFNIGNILINGNIQDVDVNSSILKQATSLLEEELREIEKTLNAENFPKEKEKIKTLKRDFLLLSHSFNIWFDFYNFAPSQMGQDSLPEKKLRHNGQNVSGVLYTLWQKEENKNDILRFIKGLPEHEFRSLKFYEDHKGRVELSLVENFGGVEQERDIELLSDGTLKVLGIAAAILSARPGSTIIIEEIDNGIHPSRAKYLLETMFYFAEKKILRLLLSTHNPALMDALPDKALGDVVFAYRDPKEGDSRLVRLSDLDDYVGLVSQGPLGELVTQGIVDRFVKNPISKEDKKQKALSWLNEMRGASNE